MAAALDAGPMLPAIGSLATVLGLNAIKRQGTAAPSTQAPTKFSVTATPPIMLAGTLGA